MPRKVLVVDDNEITAKTIAEVLRASGYEVSHAPNGFAAVECANHQVIDLILMDISMPYVNGISFCNAFKEKPHTRNIPIIMVSGFQDDMTIQKAMSVGAVAYIKKPFNSEELLEMVKKYLP